MFARGVISLHTAHLSVPKTLASKSRVSITSKLIEIKGLQVLYFGHLRKTGGRGVLLACPERSVFLASRVLHRGRRVIPISSPLDLTDVKEPLLPTPLFPLHTKIPLVSPFFPLLTQKQGGGYPRKNVGAPTFLIFPLIFRIFPIRADCKSRRPASEGGPTERGGWPRRSIRGANGALERPALHLGMWRVRLGIKTSRGRLVRSGREPSRNRICRRRFCRGHIFCGRSCPSGVGSRRGR
jgi:hypothetical protein